MACRLSQDIRSEPDLGTVKELSEVNTDGAKILVSTGMSSVLHLKMYRDSLSRLVLDPCSYRFGHRLSQPKGQVTETEFANQVCPEICL